MTQELHQQVGRHDAQIEGLSERVKAVEGKLDTVLAILNQAKGGWKTLLLVAGAAGTMGALTAKFLPALFK